MLALALLVTRVGANDVHPPLPLDQLAIFANSFDARTHFHGKPQAGDNISIASKLL
jgi:hypothetical protein